MLLGNLSLSCYDCLGDAADINPPHPGAQSMQKDSPRQISLQGTTTMCTDCNRWSRPSRKIFVFAELGRKTSTAAITMRSVIGKGSVVSRSTCLTHCVRRPLIRSRGQGEQIFTETPDSCPIYSHFYTQGQGHLAGEGVGQGEVGLSKLGEGGTATSQSTRISSILQHTKTLQTCQRSVLTIVLLEA